MIAIVEGFYALLTRGSVQIAVGVCVAAICFGAWWAFDHAPASPHPCTRGGQWVAMTVPCPNGRNK